MSQSVFRSRILYFLRNEEEDGLEFLLANNSQSREGKFLEEVSHNREQAVFQAQRKAVLSNISYLAKLQVKCQEDGSRVIFPVSQFLRITSQLQEIQRQDEEDQDEQDSQQSMDVEDEEESPLQQQDKGGANGRQQQQYPIQHYEQSSNNNPNPEHRGRGRPKGAKNKKTIQREALQLRETPPLDLKLSISGSKRGKGRPKGSKNKAKDFSQQIKVEAGTETVSFGKRGKGRPKGSKNKIKLHPPLTIRLQSQKRKGRPLGSKNRTYSVESIQQDQEMEDQLVKTELVRPDPAEVDSNYCCSRCEQSKLKRKIFENQTNVEETLDSLRNVAEDLSLQNRANLIITAIRIGDWESLELLLSIVSKASYYHTPPWRVEHMIERRRFETRTLKQCLSKTGKEGNTVLLHDCYRRQQVWWKEITVQRIIESLPRQQPEAEYILDKLFAADPELRKEIYLNLPSVVRSGNYPASELLLRQALSTPLRNPLHFSQEHYELLTGNIALLNHLKKLNLIQHNQGSNYCSPIHAAAICTNSEFLRKLLQIFTDITNVEDSLGRKPIHYAAMCMNTENLSILVESGASLKEMDRGRMTPLMLACEGGMFYNVEYILEKVRDPGYINFKSQQGYTALHYALLQDSIQCIELLINDPYLDLWALTSNRGDLFHLLAGTGNEEILEAVLGKQILPYTSQDKFKRTPPMIAIRNGNNAVLVRLIENGCKLEKTDSSQNTLLHYAAAYGNIEAILILRDRLEQTKNKKGIYPWEVAVHKGHLGAAKLLEPDEALDFVEDPLSFALSSIRGTPQFLQVVRYIKDQMMGDPNFQEKSSGDGYLHLVCQSSLDDYVRIRQQETQLSIEQITDQFTWAQTELINMFVQEEGLDGYQENYFGQTPLKLCIENHNLVGLQKLLTGKLSFEAEPGTGSTLLHCLSSLVCSGLDELRFVEKKLRECTQAQLKSNLRRVDSSGFDFLLLLVKQFCEQAVRSFRRSVHRQRVALSHKKEAKFKAGSLEQQAEKKALEEFFKFQERFLSLVDFLVELGCDPNVQVADRKTALSDQFRKWGIPHFLMRFPSLKLVLYFKAKVRDFNAPNAQLMTPLHLFCQQVGKGNILGAKAPLPPDYHPERVLEALLQAGLSPNCPDGTKALPILYAARNCHYELMVILCRFKSGLNFCSVRNETPLIEVVKRMQFTAEQVEELLRLGMDPNFQDLDKRTPLHHLVFGSNSLGQSVQVFRALLQHGCKINALDKYDRSPIFYCFCQMEDGHTSNPLDKVEMLQALINHKDINLNLVDVYRRTLLHYACERDHFFSVLYLLDKNINIEAKDIEENTPLAVSLRARNLDQAALLISRGVRYGFVHEEQRLSYFAYAFQKLSAGICFLLLDHGYPIQRALQEIPNSGFKDTLIQKYILR